MMSEDVLTCRISHEYIFNKAATARYSSAPSMCRENKDNVTSGFS
jgi:hypothetical protein